VKLEQIHIVLVRTRNPMNLGAVARAMKNFGLARLTLVDPLTEDLQTARAVAVHAEDLLERMQTAPSLVAAIADARWVVGTSQRGLAGQRALPPPALAREAAARTHEGEVALVFGDEQSGLSNAELLACHDVSSIPASAEQGSLNLAQAVVVYAHQLAAEAGSSDPTPRAPRAAERELAEVERALRQLLEAAAFADPDRPGHGVAELAHTLRRAALTPAEARLWQAVLHRAKRRL
jgi:TrmH family RNA methyltransferase